MKAIRMHSKGGPELLVYEDAPKPQLQPGDAMVRVSASSITKTELTWSETYTACDGTPRLPPSRATNSQAWSMKSLPGVTDVKVGEAVYGLASFCRDGSAAEYIAIRAADLAPKPKTLDHLQAASIPLAALTAWQAFFDHASVSKGKRVLIHGAAGGVGVFAVQIANWAGAEVIATASASNHDFLGELGAHEVIDYTKVRFEDEVSDVDVVLDAVGGDTLDRSFGVLRRGGALVSVAAEPSARESKRIRSTRPVLHRRTEPHPINGNRPFNRRGKNPANSRHRAAARPSAPSLRKRSKQPRARKNRPAHRRTSRRPRLNGQRAAHSSFRLP